MRFIITEVVSSNPEDNRSTVPTPDFEHVSDLVHWLSTEGGGAGQEYCRSVADWYLAGAHGSLNVPNGPSWHDVWVKA